jgi:uncharacterized membrane protein YphA (DoxX/SURF4 family)
MKRYSPAWWVMTTVRVLLGAVFVYAAYTKFRSNYLIFAMAIDAYKILPEEGAVWVARILPWVELLLGLALIAGIWLRVTATSATLLLAVFFTAMVRAYQPDLKEGEQISCGCFGLGEPISGRTLARDGALLALSLALAIAAFRAARRKRLAETQHAAVPAAVATLAERS